MTFGERKRIAMTSLGEFLERYSVPRGLSDAGQADRIAAVSDAFARRMPTKGSYEEAMGKVFQRVSDTHLSNSWPSQAEFVAAMPNREVTGPRAQESFMPDRAENNRKAMEEGRAVPEYAIWGRGSGALDAARREEYRAGSVEQWRRVYRHDAQAKMTARYGSQVGMYF